MVTPTSDLSIAGADLHVAVVTVRGAAVPGDTHDVDVSVSIPQGSPHAIGLSPVVAAVTEAAPGAGVSLGVRGGPGGALAPGLQRPVLLPGVHPVPDTADHHEVTTWLLTCNTPSPGSDSRDTRPSPG